MLIHSVKIERFKRIHSLDVDLKEITVLIGGNNAGKSSFLQGAHFAITTLQSSAANGDATTLGVDQLFYKPANDAIKLHHKTPMTQNAGPKFTFNYKLEGAVESEIFDLTLKRGKNANISASFYSSSQFYKRASDRTRPLSIFVPGLAGIALKEEKRTDAIVTAGIAQGDSNLYLRNVLLRIISDKPKLSRFHNTIGSIFPGLTISTDYDETTHQYIDITATTGVNGTNLPLEMIGTGCLQAIQLVAYATMYDPALLLLDEPDSHLHPSNQRLLANTLLAISDSFGTKIILSTHSRHIFDELAGGDKCQVIWLKDGQKQPSKERSDVSLLLDLGALDSFEIVSSGKSKAVILTEDSKSPRLKFLLEANGFKKGEYFVQSFHGVDNIQASIPVADFFSKLGSDTYVLVHRDGDALLTDEKVWIINKIQADMPERCSVFITEYTDIEHQYCKPEHIAATYEITIAEAKKFVDDILKLQNARLSAEFANKRAEAKNKILRKKSDAPSATDLLTGDINFEYAKGKYIFGQLNQNLQDAGFNVAKLVTTKTSALKVTELEKFAERIWGK